MGKRRRLKTSEDVRRFLAFLINSVQAGEVEPQTAGRLAYIANILLKAIEGSDLQHRIEVLEKKLLMEEIKK